MKNYIELAKKVLKHGVPYQNRTGKRRFSLFAQLLRFNLDEGFPIVTTKEVKFKSVLDELLWFLSGSSNVNDMKTKIWHKWMDKNGDVETAYGRFWTSFPRIEMQSLRNGEASTTKTSAEMNFNLNSINQIIYIRDSLKKLKINPDDPCRSRLVVSAWHPDNAIISHLPPCHYTFCLHIENHRLNLHWTQRSCDVPIGLPFNIASYATLLKMFAEDAGYVPGELVCSLVDTHIYEDQIPMMEEQITREPFPLPTLDVGPDPFNNKIGNFYLDHYRHHDFIKIPVAG